MLLGGCSRDGGNHERVASAAFQTHRDTSVGRLFEGAAAAHPGESGSLIIRYGRPAFTARIAFTEFAEQSLDLQYYIWEPDAARVALNASRGVASHC
jgi:putative cardiolipin synthase